MAGTTGRFPRAARLTKGYDRRQVDAFLRETEEALRRTTGRPPTAAEIRTVGFDLVRRGYLVKPVDSYLDGLEERALDVAGDGIGWLDGSGLQSEAEALAARMRRSNGMRFPRVAVTRRGYAVRDVDAYLTDLLPVLAGGAGVARRIGVDDVRRVVFGSKRGGYAEGAVDEALDAVVDLMLRRERAAASIPHATRLP